MVIPNLPPELESEILSRVPATSLKPFRFACKRWYALCKDPRFIKKNSQCQAAATQMVLKKDQSVYSFGIDLNGIHNRYDQFIHITGKLESSLKDSEDVRISEIFHCGSLLLCTTQDNKLVVWNPCTGQTRWIIQSSSKHFPNQLKYFLGFETDNNKSSHSYKILRCYRNNQSEMYDFKSDSWRVLDVVTPNFFGLGVSLNGNTYLLDSDREEDLLVNFILRFDFTTESFGRLPLPFESDDLVAVLSVVKEEKLALLHQMPETFSMEIWMTNNTTTDEAKDFSWRLFLVVDFDTFMLNGMTRVMSFLVDEENKRVMYCDRNEREDRTRIYIVGEDIHKQVYRGCTKESVFENPLLVSYVPSLVQIPATQSNPGGKRKRLEELFQLP